MFLILLLGDGGASRKWSSHARSEKKNSGATHCAGVCLPAASKRWRHEQAGAKLASIESARSTASFAPRRTARGETMHQDSAGGGDVGEGVAQYRRTECPGTGHSYLDPRHFCAADFQAGAASARADPVR